MKKPLHQQGQSSRKAQLHSRSPFSASNTHALPHLTQQNVLQMQRLLGNYTVQRLFAADMPIQRAEADPTQTDEGLLEQGVPARFAQKIHAKTSDPQNAELSLLELLGVIENVLNEELGVIGVPHICLYFGEAGGNMGWFIPGDWKIELNADLNFGPFVNTLRDLSEDQLETAVDTAYHEGRHAEQYFRVAQLYAGVQPDVFKPEMRQRIGLPAHVIDAAADDPLDAHVDPKVVEQIRVWANLIYGLNKNYSNIVYHMYDSMIKPLEDTSQEILALLEPGFQNFPQPRQDEIKQQLAAYVPIMKNHFRQLGTYRNTKLQPELARTMHRLAEGSNDPGTIMMEECLIKLIGEVNKILQGRSLSPEPSKAVIQALNIVGSIQEIGVILEQAEPALPDQKDANEAGGEAAKALDQLHNQP
jgi:hypothetical protein